MSGSVEFFSGRHCRSTAGVNSIINGSVSLSVLVTNTTILREKKILTIRGFPASKDLATVGMKNSLLTGSDLELSQDQGRPAIRFDQIWDRLVKRRAKHPLWEKIFSIKDIRRQSETYNTGFKRKTNRAKKTGRKDTN